MSESSGNGLYRVLLKSTTLFASVQGFCVLLSLLRNKVVAVVLGPAGMGVINLYNSVIRLLVLLTGGGLGTSGVRYVSSGGMWKEDSLRACRRQECGRRNVEGERLAAADQVRGWSLLLALAGTVLTAMLSPFLSVIAFGDHAHTLAFVLLSPVVGLSTFAAGELALLKGVGCLKGLARQSVWNAFFMTFLTIPVLYFWKEDGIVPSLLLTAVVLLLTTCRYSLREIPLGRPWLFGRLKREKALLGLGVAFVLATLGGSVMDLLVRAVIRSAGSLDDVGLFSVAYMTPLTLATIFFYSLETDFYPRLSASQMNTAEAQALTSNQIEISLLSVSPVVMLAFVSLNFFVPLLFSGKFLPCVAAMQAVLVALVLRAVKLPLSYVALSHGKSSHYMILETLYAVLFVALVSLGYFYYGVTGAGFGVLATAAFDFATLLFYARRWHGYRLPIHIGWLTCAELLLTVFCAVTAYCVPDAFRWLAAIPVTLAFLLSYCELRSQQVGK